MSDTGNNNEIDLAFATTDELVAELQERTEVSIVSYVPVNKPGVYVIRCCGTLLNLAGLHAANHVKVESLLTESLKNK